MGNPGLVERKVKMMGKRIALLFLNLAIVCFLSSCATRSVQSTRANGSLGPYFAPREIRTVSGPTDNRDRIYEFLEKNVLGRKFTGAPKRDHRMHAGQTAYDFAVTTTCTDLEKTRSGLKFDMKWTVKQTNYDLDSQGRRTGTEHLVDREFISRHEVKQMKSTGEVIGHTYVVSFNTPADLDFTGQTSILRLTLTDGKLTEESFGGTYSDFFAPRGGFYCGWSTSESTFEVKDGKVVFSTLARYHDYNRLTGLFRRKGGSSYVLYANADPVR